MPMVKGMVQPLPIAVFQPEHQALPVVLSCPHAGTRVPDDLAAVTQLARSDLLGATDFGVEALVRPAAESLQVPLVSCTVARAYLDVNRASDELDPALFTDGADIPSHKARSPRVLAGLGVIPTLAPGNRSIYGNQKLAPEVLEHRLAEVHRPYHAALADFTEKTVQKFGSCILLDCHSMPAMTAAASLSLRRDRNPFRIKQVPGEGEGLSTGSVDAVLGDRFGATCAKPVVLSVLHRLWHDGLMVEWNRPYAGGFIIRRHGNPSAGVHALQFELSRDLYLTDSLTPGPNHDKVQAMVKSIIQRLGSLDSEVLSEAAGNDDRA
ncbi:MAG: hypothetical protein CBC49_000940 [Alphaproteobacteria bacterium TMED89]|nr:MAG: hypothetical protein CBC49_000940 [Alphaproteobacteria bacterium TMED89]